MGIISVQMYGAKCDSCDIDAEFGDFTCYGDEDTVRTDITAQGWYVTERDICYCEDCHSFDQEGSLIIKGNE